MARHSAIRVNPSSLAAQWTRAQSERRGRPLAALSRGGRPVHQFVENELLVDAKDRELIDELVRKHRGKVVPAPPIPPLPAEFKRDRRGSLETMPEMVRVQVNADDEALLTLDEFEEAARDYELSSHEAAATMALCRRLAGPHGRTLLNHVGRSTVLPLSTSAELSAPADPFTWPEFTAPHNITAAWQLFQAYSAVHGLSDVLLGILDAGFDIGPGGVPATATPPDGPDIAIFIPYNTIDDNTAAGGPNDESGKEWHGTWVLSAAAAMVNNVRGAAGVAGIPTISGQQVVTPTLFKSVREVYQILRCLRAAVAWGVDVVNMSFTIKVPAFWLPLSRNWDSSFQSAADNGVVVVAAAGNDGSDLPDEVVLPATRTPGVITVGALDNTPSQDRSRGDSNYGSSVDIWAPGTAIHVMPSPGLGNGSVQSGTSMAAPIVSGVIALMKAVNSRLHSADVKRILRETGHTGSPDGKVTVALNAKAALLRAMNDALPSGYFEEPNDTPGAARPLGPGPGGVLVPSGPTTIGTRSDHDWHVFTVTQYSAVTVTVRWVPGLSSLTVDLVPDDPHSRLPPKLTTTAVPGQLQISAPQAAPGTYRIVVGAGGSNIYELQVALAPIPLTPDRFEKNNQREHPARFTMKKTTGITALVVNGPGFYEANLHVPPDVDWFHISDTGQNILSESVFAILETDAPIDARLYDSGGNLLQEALNVRAVDFVMPASECFVQISGATANTYLFRVYERVKKNMLPGPLQEVEVVPHEWAPDPPDLLQKWEQYLDVTVTPELQQVGAIRLRGAAGLRLDLLTAAGVPVASTPGAIGGDGFIDLDVQHLAPGKYYARVGREMPANARLDASRSRKPAAFSLAPAW
jgi:subtilisin family serine protease